VLTEASRIASCRRKIQRFASWEAAEHVAQDMTQDLLNGEVLSAYRCEGHWHIAHLRGTKPSGEERTGIPLPLDARAGGAEIERRAKTRVKETRKLVARNYRSHAPAR
jgi:hypothetical protein